jgi:Tfp pilus assembly protein PilN
MSTPSFEPAPGEVFPKQPRKPRDLRSRGALLGLALAALWCGWRTIDLARREAVVRRELVATGAEEARLDTILEEVHAFERKKTELESRIEIVDTVHGQRPRSGSLLAALVPLRTEHVVLDRVELAAASATVHGTARDSESLDSWRSRVLASGFVEKDSEPPEITRLPNGITFEWIADPATPPDPDEAKLRGEGR